MGVVKMKIVKPVVLHDGSRGSLAGGFPATASAIPAGSVKFKQVQRRPVIVTNATGANKGSLANGFPCPAVS